VKYLRVMLMSSFFVYYVIIVLSNFSWINDKIDPMKLFHLAKFIEAKRGVYLTTYPRYEDIVDYKNRYQIERVVSLLYPKFPISKELLREERIACKELGIEFISIPISYFSDDIMDYIQIKALVEDDNKTTMIHAYFYDERLDILDGILR